MNCSPSRLLARSRHVTLAASRPGACLVLAASLMALPALASSGEVVGVEELSREGLDGRNAISSMMAADGTVIGQLAGGNDVVRWLPGEAPQLLGIDSIMGMNNLTPPISRDGSLVAVSRLWEDEDQNFQVSVSAWKQSTGWLEVHDLGLERPMVIAAGPQGDALAGYFFIDDAFYHPWVWREASGAETLVVPEGFDVGDAWALSADTRIVAGSLGVYDPDVWGFHTWDYAARWVDGEAELLHDVHGRPLSAAVRCNSDCSVVVGGGVPPEGQSGEPNWGEAWVWSESDGAIYLGTIEEGEPPYYAMASSEDGKTVVGSYGRLTESEFGLTMQQHAFVWTADGGIRPMDALLAEAGSSHLEGWLNSVATDITPDGRTVLVGGWLDDQARSLLVHLDRSHPELVPGRRETVSGQADEAVVYRIEVPEGAHDLRVMAARGTGTASIFLDYEAVPTRSSYRRSATRPGPSKGVRVLTPESGTWYVSLIGETSFQNVMLWTALDLQGDGLELTPERMQPTEEVSPWSREQRDVTTFGDESSVK